MECFSFISLIMFKANGGAVYVNGYAEIINCFGASNWANQCKTIFENSSGTCTAL